MTATQQEAWVDYYRGIYAAGNSWLDCSNPRVHEQTFGLAIEAAGPICGKRCLDIGCGRGQVALATAALQASDVVAVDIMAESIEACRERHPHITWEVGSPEDAEFCQSLGQFDIVFIIELLQLVDWRQALHILWDRVSPGGRIVAIVPNEDNPIVRRTIARFGGAYVAPNPAGLMELVRQLPDVDCWAYRGMDFQQNQRIVPYATSPWMTSIVEGFSSNRLVVVIAKNGCGDQ